jgi:hypothetical protein
MDDSIRQKPTTALPTLLTFQLVHHWNNQTLHLKITPKWWASQTIAHSHFAIEKGFVFPPSNSELLLAYKMALYLLFIHAIHWTVFCNRLSLPESTWFVAYC